jgi:hypothetical protein
MTNDEIIIIAIVIAVASGFFRSNDWDIVPFSVILGFLVLIVGFFCIWDIASDWYHEVIQGDITTHEYFTFKVQAFSEWLQGILDKTWQMIKSLFTWASTNVK